MKKIPFLLVIGLLSMTAIGALAATQFIKISKKNNQICVESNGIADHDMGRFPRKGSPHRIKTQKIKFCVTANPIKGDQVRMVRTVGIAKNGIIIRPGTADYYDASSPRGHSRDSSSGWNLDGIGPNNTLGLDRERAHVDNRGLYHYNGIAPTLAASLSDSRIGLAADGFEIHYIGDSAKPSWILKRGMRPTAPGGKYDGSYNEDFEFVSSFGNLDECNGAVSQGTYKYFATHAYPFFPRCLFGKNISKFR